ncbi:hypothetical protein B0F90DRAFT_1815217 [Multifurca ochricompacta]|uniref:Uncharacterized protein n=1 Tax=Multifurca ochricompacta TaxID=376703 RepID=A0AAD4QQY1_9AGAM|nr:hypothetical protein B0F90DRAFT_1815217 [Multifurca ochricompacta]
MVDSDSSQKTLPRFGTPGTPDFFASLLDHIRTTTPHVPLDPVIFQSIILGVMAGNKHIVLRTKEEDITIVQNLAALILTDILGYATHKHKIVSQSDISSSSFVPSLFSSHYQGAPTSKPDSYSSLKTRSKRSRFYPASEGYRRTASEPNTSSFDTPITSQRQGASADIRPNLLLPPLFHVTGTHSDSSGLTEPESPRIQHSSGDSWLPTALVLTGLEHSSIPCHRALLRTLVERRVSLDKDTDSTKSSFWVLPEDFILLYVCRFDPRERPSVHKSLLNRFSLSVAVAIHPSTREAYTTYLASHFGTQSSSLSPTPAQSTFPNPAFPRNFLPRLRSFSTLTHVNIHASLRLYIADLIAAARHHHELDGTLLGVHCVEDAEAFVCAHRVLGAGDVGPALIERAAALSAESAAGSSLSLHNGVDPSVHLHWAEMGPSAMLSPSRSISSMSGAWADWLHTDPQEKWDASEVDIAKVVPRIISHRLCVRKGPEDEVMAGIIFMVTAPRVPAGTESKDGVWRRRTVKEILVKLMGEV